MASYINISKKKKKHKPITKKKNVATVATTSLGTVVIVQNLEKKKWLTKPKPCS